MAIVMLGRWCGPPLCLSSRRWTKQAMQHHWQAAVQLEMEEAAEATRRVLPEQPHLEVPATELPQPQLVRKQSGAHIACLRALPPTKLQLT